MNKCVGANRFHWAREAEKLEPLSEQVQSLMPSDTLDKKNMSVPT